MKSILAKNQYRSALDASIHSKVFDLQYWPFSIMVDIDVSKLDSNQFSKLDFNRLVAIHLVTQRTIFVALTTDEASPDAAIVNDSNCLTFHQYFHFIFYILDFNQASCFTIFCRNLAVTYTFHALAALSAGFPLHTATR